MHFTYILDDLRKVARDVWGQSEGKKVWAIHGEIGAGKTTFIHAFCEVAGVTSAIGSPTYSIINEYQSNEGIIYHMDWYRLKDKEEALQAGVEDCMTSGNLCLIEWPERAVSLLPDDTFHLIIEVVDEQTRSITILPNKANHQ